MDIRKKIGLRIKKFRSEDLKLTQEALAFKADLDKSYLNEVENGKRNISVLNLEKIITALGVSISDFFKAEEFTEAKKKRS